MVVKRLSVYGSYYGKRKTKIVLCSLGLHNGSNLCLCGAGTHCTHRSTVHVYRYINSLFNLLNLFGSLIVALINYSLNEFHGYCRILSRWVYAQQFLQPHAMFTAIGGQEMYSLPF